MSCPPCSRWVANEWRNFRKYDRQTHRSLRPDHPLQPRQIELQHLRIEKQQRGQRVIIYDSREVAALYDMECAFEKRDYRAYCESWRKKFSVRRKKIRAAARRLPETRGFLPLKYQKNRLDALITKIRFVDRIFDIYLWETGAEG